jgi:hypothetical protein
MSSTDAPSPASSRVARVARGAAATPEPAGRSSWRTDQVLAARSGAAAAPQAPNFREGTDPSEPLLLREDSARAAASEPAPVNVRPPGATALLFHSCC